MSKANITSSESLERLKILIVNHHPSSQIILTLSFTPTDVSTYEKDKDSKESSMDLSGHGSGPMTRGRLKKLQEELHWLASRGVLLSEIVRAREYNSLWFGLLGSHFCNQAMSSLLEKYGVVYRVNTAYHPQTNSQAKVFNREIKKILQKMANPSQKD
ncbi:hypothetical protein CR513_08546, partial [Mucuna pruriens]